MTDREVRELIDQRLREERSRLMELVENEVKRNLTLTVERSGLKRLLFNLRWRHRTPFHRWEVDL